MLFGTLFVVGGGALVAGVLLQDPAIALLGAVIGAVAAVGFLFAQS